MVESVCRESSEPLPFVTQPEGGESVVWQNESPMDVAQSYAAAAVHANKPDEWQKKMAVEYAKEYAAVLPQGYSEVNRSISQQRTE